MGAVTLTLASHSMPEEGGAPFLPAVADEGRRGGRALPGWSSPQSLPTLAAASHVLLGMDTLMPGQVGGADEALSALGAPVGHVPRVDAPVLSQVVGVVEAFPTLGALVGLLPSVHPLVQG